MLLYLAIVFVMTLVRINWKKESDKAMKCARGSLAQQQLETEQDREGDETIQGQLSRK